MEAVITFAETGHLVLATLHANNANQAMERILNFFPHERHEQILLQLSLNLKSIISQRLIPSTDGTRVAAIEILLDTPRVKDLIYKNQVALLKEAMALGSGEGMQTFDQAIFDLYKKGRLNYDNALAYADSVNDLRLKIKLDKASDEKAPVPSEDKLEEKFRLRPNVH
jgi:twitching motility protein PilU